METILQVTAAIIMLIIVILVALSYVERLYLWVFYDPAKGQKYVMGNSESLGNRRLDSSEEKRSPGEDSKISSQADSSHP